MWNARRWNEVGGLGMCATRFITSKSTFPSTWLPLFSFTPWALGSHSFVQTETWWNSHDEWMIRMHIIVITRLHRSSTTPSLSPVIVVGHEKSLYRFSRENQINNGQFKYQIRSIGCFWFILLFIALKMIDRTRWNACIRCFAIDGWTLPANC